MISAFGVEHTISKGLPKTFNYKMPAATDTMAQRMKTNYGQWRAGAHHMGNFSVKRGLQHFDQLTATGRQGLMDDMDKGKRLKRNAKHALKASENINRRRKRVLP